MDYVNRPERRTEGKTLSALLCQQAGKKDRRENARRVTTSRGWKGRQKGKHSACYCVKRLEGKTEGKTPGMLLRQEAGREARRENAWRVTVSRGCKGRQRENAWRVTGLGVCSQGFLFQHFISCLIFLILIITH